MDLPQRSECVHSYPLGQMIRVRAEAPAGRLRSGGVEELEESTSCSSVPGIVAGG